MDEIEGDTSKDFSMKQCSILMGGFSLGDPKSDVEGVEGSNSGHPTSSWFIIIIPRRILLLSQ
jgi:hypothetical protein